MDAALLDLSAGVDGYVVWLDDCQLSKHPTWEEASAAYLAALALATGARERLGQVLRERA